MEDILLAGLIAFSLCSLLLKGLIRFAPDLKLMDTPGGRKQHLESTPLVGGLAISLSLTTVLLWPEFRNSQLVWLAPPLLILILIGLHDDRNDSSPRFRFFAQILAAVFTILGTGTAITHLGDLFGQGLVSLGLLSIPVTVFAILSAINAFNMSDGLDGLAGGLTLIPLIILTSLAAKHGLFAEATLGCTLSSATVAFLLVNYRFPWTNRAQTFLGDTGSMVLGFCVAWLLISLSESGAISPVTALYLIAFPLIDTAAVLVRRKLADRPLTSPGRDHFHHILRNADFSVRQTVAIIHTAALLMAGVGLSLSKLGVNELSAFLIFICVLGFFVWLNLPKSRSVPTPRIELVIAKVKSRAQ
ncbi:undecaprenyl/decaprenyl-phosphate alpha-N-acetylglucosaminyl 1-phosphate transferase [Spongiibacter sp. KMU-158]|uniref:Undecaprenyl/decaprenyl-phosphate alpha-N-acetylglucosaminyl 1-phosphate transferase n=1 Tax=Spongiibacter pelagi TaxID=2760804 RepID=A0A927GWB7_9GAMM|nr:MraY family glycosyltransferase [Spongiibacter pelagi]MBD2859280.1 undecaprenyl/decaprenyl-phosphate alpha-N-acetylglucosaminyl 1-phosphate transferase [Spongiibacter pelagi]